MADEVLSANEVEMLLSAMEDSGTAPPPPAPADEPETPRKRGKDKKDMPYDFKRPERVGKEQMRALQSLHEGFARNYGAALSALLRTIVEVKLASADQMTYSEFVFSLENPTCFNVLRAEPLEGNLVLDMNPSIVYPIIDRLLGGGKEAAPPARRPMTEIELRLMSRTTDLFLEELKGAWEHVLSLRTEVEKVESNPQLAQIVPPNEVIVLISFEVSLADVRGMFNLCIPYNAIEKVSSELANNSWVSYSPLSNDQKTVESIGNQLEGSSVELVVTLAETRLRTADMIGLRVGDIITTDKDVRTPLDISVQGVPKMTAQAGTFKGHKAIQVVS